MGKTYLVNAFSLNMIKNFPANVVIDKIDKDEFCTTIDTEEEYLVNAVGHDSTIALINTLCGTKLQKNRVEIKLDKGDRAIVIMITQRLEEGKVLNHEEITKMYEEGKIGFYEVWIK
ncbi:hypothetical protein STIV2_B116 [Sulfolobus turreted icosahedral virus 2]|uniref:Uncharacterized protein n=1 Tax=Sulfolobus turreted icosahedral virus 2 TaxID=754004 RepID=D5IEY5_9VIRU|nr:hypothetical protein STIV2_B116 [Sulfolobus turreted icosahedral virus 2]ADF27757.1 hypothetical protein STIV2_B116 [Sulfolobus turreted icosahedral virus 2]